MNSSLLNTIWTNEFYRSERGEGHDFSWNIRKRNYSYCREREFHARYLERKHRSWKPDTLDLRHDLDSSESRAPLEIT